MRCAGSPATGRASTPRSAGDHFPAIAATGSANSSHCSISSVVGLTHVLPWGKPLTYDDLQAMPDDGHRYELIDGVLIVTPSPRHLHQRAVASLLVLLHDASPSEIEVLTGPFDYVVSDVTVLEPDVIVAGVRIMASATFAARHYW